MKNESLLTYVLPRLSDGAIAFAVEEQSDRVTNYLIARGGCFVAKNGWRVIISEYPEIKRNQKIIYLRGSNSNRDTRPDRIWDLKKKEADELTKSIHTALEDLVSAAKNWKLRYDTVFAKTFVIEPIPIINPFSIFGGRVIRLG